MTDRERRTTDPAQASMTIRLYRKEQIDRLIADLKAARKTALHRGGQVLVVAHDHKRPGVCVHLEVDLTTEALRRHIDDIH